MLFRSWVHTSRQQGRFQDLQLSDKSSNSSPLNHLKSSLEAAQVKRGNHQLLKRSLSKEIHSTSSQHQHACAHTYTLHEICATVGPYKSWFFHLPSKTGSVNFKKHCESLGQRIKYKTPALLTVVFPKDKRCLSCLLSYNMSRPNSWTLSWTIN